ALVEVLDSVSVLRVARVLTMLLGLGMCCGLLFTELVFLVLYVLTAPALTLSSGPHLLLHLYLIYTGYTALGVLLSSLSQFLREVIQVCVCGVVLVSYPLAVIPTPILSVVECLLLAVPPLLALLEGFQIYLLVTRLSRTLASHIDDNEELCKGAILALSAASLAVSAYLSVYCIELPPAFKVTLFLAACVLLVVNIAVEEGVISDACLLILANYLLLTTTLSEMSPSAPLPLYATASQAQTMLGAIVRIPQLISFGVSSVVPYVKQLLSPLPLTMLALRVISVASFSDGLLKEESWVRGLGKFLIVTLYTSYVLTASQHSHNLVLFGGFCRGCEAVILLGCYGRYLFGYTDLDESFS
ncbi:hypothetical protein ACHWQZ_G010524, partial [Mnemiopsis leidyi]